MTVGWWLNDLLGDGPKIVVNRPLVVPAEQIVQPDVVPNVLGLDANLGRQVYVDAGFDASTIRVVTKPYAGDQGLVVDQEPAPGAPKAATVTLFVSSEATVPDLIGTDADTARQKLADLGARVVVQRQFSAGQSPDTVLAVAPGVGAPLASDVTLTVSDPASSVFLTKISGIASDCSGGNTARVNGTEYTETIQCSTDPTTPRVMEYVLNRRLTAFTATVGVEDSSPTPAPVTFRVIADGKVLFSQAVPFGVAKTLSVSVSGALRLRLEAVAATSVDSPPVGVWADPQLEGGESAIDAFAKAP